MQISYQDLVEQANREPVSEEGFTIPDGFLDHLKEKHEKEDVLQYAIFEKNAYSSDRMICELMKDYRMFE